MNTHFEPQIATFGADDSALVDPFAALLVEPIEKPFDLPFDFSAGVDLGLARPLSLRRQSSAFSTPFEPAEDDLTAQFLQCLPEDDAATPALIFDEPLYGGTQQDSLFSLPSSDAPSPSFAFRQYAPLLPSIDATAALKTPPTEPLPYTCSPVELTADSPPFAPEQQLPDEQPIELEQEEEVLSKSRKRKAAAANFTGSRNTTIPLVEVDAPIAARKYTGNSRTSRKVVPVLYQRQTKKQKLDIIDEHGEVLPEHQEAIEAKRLANTVAARRSRQRKAEHLKTLEDTIALLKAQLEEEQAKVCTLEQENARLKAAA